VYHCVTRLVDHHPWLDAPALERLRLMLWRQAAFSGVEIITYCLMSNHFHVLVRVPKEVRLSDPDLLRLVRNHYGPSHTLTQVLEAAMQSSGTLSADLRDRLHRRMGDVSVFMKELKQRFSIYYNRTRRRRGTLWSERFTSLLVEDAPPALRTVASYIDLNPVRAGLVKDPARYRFCGYAEAEAGEARAREGLLNAYVPYGELDAPYADTGSPASWEILGGEYRRSLLLQAGRAKRTGQASLDRGTIKEKLARGDALEPGEAMRLKIRYMTDGMVLGSKEYVEGVFRQFRDRFGPKRRTGARALKALGLSLKHLAVMRALRKRVIE